MTIFTILICIALVVGVFGLFGAFLVRVEDAVEESYREAHRVIEARKDQS